MVMDQTTDPNGQTLHRLTRPYEPPEFVKVATHEQITGMGRDLPPESFADPRTMQFPTHTPAAVVTSAMYLLEAEPGLGKLAEIVRQRVDRAAEYFGVKGHVDKIREKAAAALADAEKPARTPEDEAKHALIAAALERAKAQKEQAHPENTSNLSTEQQAEIAAIEARRAEIREQAKPHLRADD